MKALTKDLIREIKNTSSRFISILILVALAVAFLSGLRATAPDMKETLDAYMDAQRFMDIQVFSTLGLSEDDLEALAAQPGVAFAEGSHQTDAFASVPDGDLVVKVYGLPSQVNRLILKSGRMPQSSDECLADKAFLSASGYEIGSSFSLSEGVAEEDEVLSGHSFTICGVVASPYYISTERGTASIGSGSVDAFIYIPDECFDIDYYTAAYVLAEGADGLVAFSPEYDDLIKGLISSLEPFAKERAQLRYDSLIGDANDELDKAQGELDKAKAEAEAELADAQRQLADARMELDDGWDSLRRGEREYERGAAEAQQQIDEGEAELADAQMQLADAEAELAAGEAELADAQRELDAAAAELEDAQVQIEEARLQLEEGKAELDEAHETLLAGEEAYASGQAKYSAGRSEYEAGKAQLEENRPLYQLAKDYLPQAESQLAVLREMWEERPEGTDVKAYALSLLEQAYQTAVSAGLTAEDIARLRSAIDDAKAQTEQIDDPDALVDSSFAEVDGYLGEARDMITQFEAGEAELAAAAAQLSGAEAQLEGARQQLADGWAQYYAGLEEYETGVAEYEQGVKDYEDGLAKYNEGLEKYNSGKAELAEGRAEYEKGLREYEDGLAGLEKAKVELPGMLADARAELASAKRQLEDGESEYAQGVLDYEEGKARAESEIADAQEKLSDARRQISKISGCEWYVLDRGSNPGYLGFGQDADRMANLANVFPLLFFLVAALVCLTTMTRMVDDERIQIGSLKALGYTTAEISRKYLVYGALPALIGAAAGLALGYTLFPKMIFTAYQIMYEVPNLTLKAYADISVFSVAAALACTVLATLWACVSALRAVPAKLMRPKAPSAGKRVFLEYIKPLWKRMGFFGKVTSRNLFRYQKRFWMTVIGIGGCTALIIAGFGLRYSLLATMDRQFGEIFRYQAVLNTDKDIIEEDRQSIEDFLSSDPDIDDVMPAYMNAVTVQTDAYQTTAYLQVCDAGRLGEYVDLRSYPGGDGLALDEDGVIIGSKLAELLDVGPGDSLTIESGSRAELKVTAVNEHYLGHYIYMVPALYRSAFGSVPADNTYLLKLSSDSDEVCRRIFEAFMGMEGSSGTSRIADVRRTYFSSVGRIDFVVVIVIICAAALAMVVLYNLSNINITERKRELATIKVLGFFDVEVSAYIYRENIVLTVFGIALGIFMGHWLHGWMIRSVEIDTMMFGRDTDPHSYLFAAVLTAVFSVIVNVMAHRKMKQIDMVESLKSAE